MMSQTFIHRFINTIEGRFFYPLNFHDEDERWIVGIKKKVPPFHPPQSSVTAHAQLMLLKPYKLHSIVVRSIRYSYYIQNPAVKYSLSQSITKTLIVYVDL